MYQSFSSPSEKVNVFKDAEEAGSGEDGQDPACRMQIIYVDFDASLRGTALIGLKLLLATYSS